MKTLEQKISDNSIEIVARSFFRESLAYGFKQEHYLRFVNLLIDLAMSNHKKAEVKQKSKNRLKDPKPISLPLQGNRVIIRAFEAPRDQPVFDKWLADEYGRHFLLSCMTAKKMTLDDLINKKSNIFSVICLIDKTPIGSVAFLNYDPLQQKAELRKLIGDPKMRGMGFAKEATQLWIQYGTTTLGLKKIYLNTLNTNIRNIKLNEELGFKVEGILRNEVFFDGKYHDVLRMGLLNE